MVIPCYVQTHFLSEAIQIVLYQNYTACEVIVVDDGSVLVSALHTVAPDRFPRPL